MGPQKTKKRKIEKKKYNCAVCKVTVPDDGTWLNHLNGKRHRNTLNRSAKVEMNKKVSSDIDDKWTCYGTKIIEVIKSDVIFNSA
jgi:Zinc-finger of C2H2 type